MWSLLLVVVWLLLLVVMVVVVVGGGAGKINYHCTTVIVTSCVQGDLGQVFQNSHNCQ